MLYFCHLLYYGNIYKPSEIKKYMVFENLIGPVSAKKNPMKLFFLGIVFSIIAVVFSLWIFKQQASLIMVFLVVIMSLPLVYFTFNQEEEEDWIISTEGGIIKEHSKAIKFLMYLFLGFTVGFSLAYIFLPDITVHNLFSAQLQTISNINNNISGGTIETSTFFLILTNNLKVMFFCLLFAFFFGAGAIFILAWNASVISAAIGTYFRNGLAEYAHILGWNKAAICLQLFVGGLLRYLLHGVFEIAAYFFAGLAGGIISIALINYGIKNKGFKKIAIDVSVLMSIAIGLLIIGAIIEVFVTPLLF